MDDQYESGDEEIYSYKLLLECEHSKRVVECKSKVAALQSILEEVQELGSNSSLMWLSTGMLLEQSLKPYLLQCFSSEWNEYVDVIISIVR